MGHTLSHQSAPDWQPPGNTHDIDEYLRRQTMSARDYRAFLARLERDFPDEPFLILRFGDHQPAIASDMLEPGSDPATISLPGTASPRTF